MGEPFTAPGAGATRKYVDTKVATEVAAQVAAQVGALSEAAITNEVDAQLDARLPGEVSTAVAPAVQSALDAGNFIEVQGMGRVSFYGENPPAGTTLEQFLPEIELRVKPNHNGQPALFYRRVTSPQQPGDTDPPPTTATPTQMLNDSWTHYKATWINAAGAVVSSDNATVGALANALTMAVLQKDQATFGKLFDYDQSEMRRRDNGFTTSYPDLYIRSVTVSTGAAIDTGVDCGENLKIAGAIVCAWNLWGEARWRDTGSLMARDLKALAIIDEGRAYLPADEQQKLNAQGHHSANGGWYSKHEIGKINPTIFAMLKTFTGDTIFDQFTTGYYDLLAKSTSSSGNLATSKALPPRYVAYDTLTHNVSVITSGTNGWAESASTSFDDTAADTIRWLRTHHKTFNDQRALTFLSGTIKTAFYAPTWAGGSIGGEYSHGNGTLISAVETTSTYYHALESTKAGDGDNATAAAIQAAKIPDVMGSDGNGYWFPNQIKGVTPVTSRGGDAGAWLGLAIDNGLYNELARLGANPSAGTTNPGGTTTPPSTGAEKLYVDTNSSRFLALGWALGLPNGTATEQEHRRRALWFASIASGHWVGDWDASTAGVNGYINNATAAGAWALVLSYYIPGKDMGQYSAGGAATRAAYETYINNLANSIGTRKVILCYEPDSLPHMTSPSMDPNFKAGRISIMNWAIRTLKSRCPNLKLYVDAGHSNWASVAATADLLRQVGVENSDGIATNVSNFRPDGEIIPWSQAVLDTLGIAHLRFVYDTGRNGNPTPPQASDFPASDSERFANPRRRQIGQLPQHGGSGLPRLCAGRHWWKRAGESDGNNGDGAPGAGQWFPLYMLNTAVGDRVDGSTHATSSGMLQRPGTLGVAGGA